MNNNNKQQLAPLASEMEAAPTSQSLGLVDNPVFSTDDSEKFLHQDELAAIDAVQPSLQPQPKVYNQQIVDLPYQVSRNNEEENFEQWEARTLKTQKDNLTNRTSIYHQAPVSSGIPNIPENKQTTSEGLAKARKEHEINELANKLAFVSNNIIRHEKQLANLKSIKKTIEKNLKGLANTKALDLAKE